MTDSGLMTMDGYDDCVVGYAERYGMDTVVAYDKTKVLEKLQKDGMTIEEALEWFDFNMIGAWVGEHTPIFITVMPLSEVEESISE